MIIEKFKLKPIAAFSPVPADAVFEAVMVGNKNQEEIAKWSGGSFTNGQLRVPVMEIFGDANKGGVVYKPVLKKVTPGKYVVRYKDAYRIIEKETLELGYDRIN